MPILKVIAGHTGCKRIKDYLEKNGRALARDFMNFDYQIEEGQFEDGREFPDDFDWAASMDKTRTLRKNDTPWKGKHARTFKHFVLSPNPEDNLSLNELRELARSWTEKYFGEFEAAIIYHDDNGQNIPHAHIVVNNTNIYTGYRLQTENPYELNRTLQDMAEERGFHFLRDEAAEPESGPAEYRQSHGPATLQTYYLRRSEISIAKDGGYSWVTDIRNRITIAKTLARNEGEFRAILDALDIDVSENSERAMRRDWIYSIKDTPTHRIGGEKLGLTFGRTSLQERFERKAAYHPTAESSRDILSHARDAVTINDLEDLGELSKAMSVCARYNARSLSELDSRITRATERGSENAFELTQARNYLAQKELLPERPPRQLQQQPRTHVQQTQQQTRRDRQEQQQLAQMRQRQQERRQQRGFNR